MSDTYYKRCPVCGGSGETVAGFNCVCQARWPQPPKGLVPVVGLLIEGTEAEAVARMDAVDINTALLTDGLSVSVHEANVRRLHAAIGREG